MDVEDVAEKFRNIELDILKQTVPRAKQSGKKRALELARQRVLELRAVEGDVETTVEMPSPPFQAVAVAMAVRYGLDVGRRPETPGHEFLVFGPRTFVHTVYGPVVEEMNVRLEKMFVGFATEVLEAIGAPLPEESRE